MTKTRKDGDKGRDDHFADIRRRRDAKRKARDDAIRSAAESARPGMETRAAINLAAWGTGDKPIGIPQTKITVDSTTWARWIADAGRRWATFPGIAVLDERPAPDIGLGYDEGRRIFKMACDGASVKAIARELRKSREALGQPAGDFDHGDTELGLWGFFRQLDRYFDGHSWSPPRPGRMEASEDEARSEVPATADAPFSVMVDVSDAREAARMVTDLRALKRDAHEAAELKDGTAICEGDSGRESSEVLRHSADFTSIVWTNGMTYTFTKTQAQAVKVLWAEFEKGGLTLGEETIGQTIGSGADDFRMSKLFAGHQAWKDGLFESPRKGTFRLKRAGKGPQNVT